MVSIGSARVSTDEQTTEGQIALLENAGCVKVFTENASGGDRQRPQLSKVMSTLKRGDVLMVVRIDRLARSLSHLLEIIEKLTARGVGFRSLGDPIDTTTSSGVFTLQILGAVAEFERALIRERTKAGMVVAAKQGKQIGNPGLIDKDPEALAKITAARDALRTQAILDTADDYLPVITALRPSATWAAVADVLNRKRIARPGSASPWSRDSVIRVAKRLVSAGLADETILASAPRTAAPKNLTAVIAGLSRMDPDATLEQIGQHMREMGQVTPQGSSRWSRSSVKSLLDQAKNEGLLSRPE